MTIRTIAMGVLCFGLTVGCKAPVEAPEDLGELTLFLFENFDQEEGEELITGSVGMEEYLLSLDLEGKVNDRTVTLPQLPEDRMGTVTPTDGADASLQVPVGVSAISRHDLSANLELIAEPNQVCIDSDTSKFSERVFLTDINCFVDGTCDTLETTQWVRKENALAKIWFELHRNYRTVELEDGRTAMYARGWLPRVYDSDNGKNTWDQNYSLEVWIPDPSDEGKTLRFYGLWSSVHLDLIGDDAWAVLVKGGLDQNLEWGDEFLDPDVAIDDYCNEDRDADYTPPSE